MRIYLGTFPPSPSEDSFIVVGTELIVPPIGPPWTAFPHMYAIYLLIYFTFIQKLIIERMDPHSPTLWAIPYTFRCSFRIFISVCGCKPRTCVWGDIAEVRIRNKTTCPFYGRVIKWKSFQLFSSVAPPPAVSVPVWPFVFTGRQTEGISHPGARGGFHFLQSGGEKIENGKILNWFPLCWLAHIHMPMSCGEGGNARGWQLFLRSVAISQHCHTHSEIVHVCGLR